MHTHELSTHLTSVTRLAAVMEAITFVLLFTGFALCALGLIARSFVRRIRRQTASHCQHAVPAPEYFDSSTSVVVVGSGVLGSAIGAVLSRDGRQVTIIERDLSEPDRIVGELLQPGGYKALKKLGLEEATEGIDAHTVYGYVIHDDDSKSRVDLSYPLDEHKKVSTGRSFHHGRFIMGLRREATKAGASMVEGTCSSILIDNRGHIAGVSYKDKETGKVKTIKAELTIIADGCFSKFRKGLTNAPVSVSSHFAGLIMHNCSQIKPGHAEIVLTKNGPVLVYQISNNSTRILVDIQGKMPSEISDYMMSNVLPDLPEHMREPFSEAVKNDRIRSMPNSFLPPVANLKPGVILLGDAYNMRHPLTGAGMSVALNDVVIWRDLLATVPHLSNHEKILDKVKNFQWRRKQSHSFVINILAQALYALFSASDEYLHELRKACFAYFKLGGMAVSGPVGLLSVLKPHPVILIGHFFAVALYAIYHTFKSCQLWSIPRGIYRAVMIFSRACMVIFPLMGSELLSLV